MNTRALINIPAITIFIIILTCTNSFSWPLDSALARGDSCITISWVPDSANTDPSWYVYYGTQCTGSDSIYLHCDFIPGRTYNGVAYSYGGEDPWYLFRSRIDSGFFAGSHLCHYNEYGDPSDTITGTDCSGYLCYIWNVPRMSTSAIVQSSLFEEIDKKDLRAGDGLVRGGYHCVFVVEADDPAETVIWEASSSVFGCRERITDMSNSYWEPYTALRYPEITKIFHHQSKNPHRASYLISMKVLSSGKTIISSLYSQEIQIQMYTMRGQLIDRVTIPAHTENFELTNCITNSNGIYIVSFVIRDHPVLKKQIALTK
jgi:hypothetical protein